MWRYVVKRILMMIPVLIGVDFLVFSILFLSPVDPTITILGAEAPPEMRQELREEMGLDDPYLVQYKDHILAVISGDFGNSYKNSRPVVTELAERIPVTFTIASVSIILAVVIGLVIGLISAAKQYSIFDYVSMVTALLLGAVPLFFMCMVLVVIFSINLGWLPASGASDWKGFVLPVIATAMVSLTAIMRMTRSSLLEVVRQDYIRTIRAKGAPERYILFKHALKNAILPIITVAGTTFGALMGGTVVCETIFALRGVGSFLIEGVRNQDRPVVMVTVLFISLSFSIVNLLVDLLYAFFDPRIRGQYSGK